MKDKIIQITSIYRWTGNWEDSSQVIHGLGESGKLYVLHEPYGEGKKSYWEEITDSPTLSTSQPKEVKNHD